MITESHKSNLRDIIADTITYPGSILQSYIQAIQFVIFHYCWFYNPQDPIFRTWQSTIPNCTGPLIEIITAGFTPYNPREALQPSFTTRDFTYFSHNHENFTPLLKMCNFPISLDWYSEMYLTMAYSVSHYIFV